MARMPISRSLGSLSRKLLAVGAALSLTAALTGLPAPIAPVTAPAVAQQAAQLPGLSAKDRQVGQQGYQEIVKEFGGPVTGPIADYVRSIALKVAMAAIPGSQASDWTITVLDSPIPNAMATPGGYLYITRGLLAMINSEAELASVLGHEAGHVAARHSDKRNSRATLGGLATIAAAIFGGQQIAQVANIGASAWVSGYSRGQENEADSLGMRYIMAAGYDPMAAADMLASLDRVSIVEGKQERDGAASIFSTHPVTAERVARVRKAAEQSGQRGGTINAAPYLAAINGLTYGDSPDQGMISGTSFRHGTIGIAFTAPPGFSLQNRPDAVNGQAANGANFSMFGARLQPGQTLTQLVDQTWQQLTNNRSPGIQSRQDRINGLEAVQSVARLTSQGRPVDVGVTAYRLSDDQVFLFRTVAPAGQSGQFTSLLHSFRQLTPAERAEAKRGLHIETVRVKAGDTAASLAARMPAPYNRAESLLALNGLGNQPLQAGQTLKLIVD